MDGPLPGLRMALAECKSDLIAYIFKTFAFSGWFFQPSILATGEVEITAGGVLTWSQ